MKPLKFKIGDKVRIIKFPDSSVIGEVGEVTNNIEKCGYVCEVRLLLRTDWICVMRAEEIEHAVRVGEQLLFDFMNEVT